MLVDEKGFGAAEHVRRRIAALRAGAIELLCAFAHDELDVHAGDTGEIAGDVRVNRETHADPGDQPWGVHRGDHELIGALVDHHQAGGAAQAAGPFENILKRQGARVRLGAWHEGGQAAGRIGQHGQICLRTVAEVAQHGALRGLVLGGDRGFEAVVGGQNADRGQQLVGAQCHELVEDAIGDLQRVAGLIDALFVGAMQNGDGDQQFRQQHEPEQRDDQLMTEGVRP